MFEICAIYTDEMIEICILLTKSGMHFKARREGLPGNWIITLTGAF